MRLLKTAGLAVAALCALTAAGAAQAAPIRNIVLVHGAFVDGSGWRPVYDILSRHGYRVSIVQEPLTGLADDVAATRRILERQDGPAILVGHSYGGAIITEAGADPHVAGLVYIAAHAPDEGETESGNGKRYPAAGRAAITPLGADGYVWIDPARYHADFAADLPAAEAAFEARAQGVTAAKVFTTPITAPAWKTRPSWYMVAGADRIISPDLERMYAARARSRKVVEVAGASHSVYRSHPAAVAALIEDAARDAGSAP
ncbi:MAG: Alpha/beta hydrolase [Phenylobacterium sp.]|jgi:pimeloyl-ACP methyl ester carboxylesterase|nr:Alpha/beta hydrolase [Phenylobacterium sp.]